MFFQILGQSVIGYYLIRFIAQFFFDCDLYMAYKEKFGKPIGTLRNKVVWITGASSGIGENLAYTLARAGCKLVLSARREAELFKVKEKCISDNKSLTEDDIEVLVLDVLDIETHEQAFKHVIDKFGKLDILVNNAGRSQRALWADIEIDVDRQMFELNVFAVISLSRIALKYFLKRGKGHLAVTSSLAGLIGVPFSATYSATKHALHGYFDALRVEIIKRNIATTIFCPGPVQTNSTTESFTGKSGEKLGKKSIPNSETMSVQRSGELFASALANEINEVWACSPKWAILSHIWIHYPSLLKLILVFVTPRHILRLRDSKELIKVD